MYRSILMASCLLLSGTTAQSAGFYVFPDVNNPINQDAYDCVVRDGLVLQSDGTFTRDNWMVERAKDRGPFKFIAGSGVMIFEHENANDMKWTILHPGDERFTLIAHIPYSDPMYATFRLEVWNSEGIVFTWAEGTDVFSGLCSKSER